MVSAPVRQTSSLAESLLGRSSRSPAGARADSSSPYGVAAPEVQELNAVLVLDLDDLTARMNAEDGRRERREAAGALSTVANAARRPKPEGLRCLQRMRIVETNTCAGCTRRRIDEQQPGR